MSSSLQVHFRGMEPSPSLNDRALEHFEYLTTTFQRQPIISGHLTIELLNHRTGKAGSYHATLTLGIPGKTLAAVVGGGRNDANLSAYEALADAFSAMDRQLKEHAQKLRQEVKHAGDDEPLQGRVIKLFADDGYGFIATVDGREIYFNENAVLGQGFEQLANGTLVRFTEEEGEKGPQASTVHPMPHHTAILGL